MLVLGDPAQLPPVRGGGFFTQGEPDVMLTEIHRQAGESAIIRLATMARQGKPNHALSGQEIDAHTLAEETALRFLDNAAARLGWSARGLHRTLKVARTIADLGAAPRITLEHVAEALQYRPALR